MENKSKIISVFIGLVLLVVVLFFLSWLHDNSSKNAKTGSSDACTSQQLSIGSSGSCVSDAQTMVNFLESDGLTQCLFIGASPLNINGVYDATTEGQVKVVQTWLNCYNKQEGEATTINPDGNITASTWSALCTFSYLYPSQSNQSPSPYFKQSLQAGKAAGCASS